MKTTEPKLTLSYFAKSFPLVSLVALLALNFGTAVHAQNCVTPPAGLVSWWQAESNTLDFSGTNNATAHGGLTYVVGKVRRAFQFNGSGAYLTSPASSSLNVGSGAGFTIECWIKSTNLSTWQPLLEWNNGTNFGVHFWININGPASLYGDILDTSGTDHSFHSPNNILTTSNFYHVALTYDKSSGTAVLYCNGVAVATQNFGSFTPQTAYPLYMARRPPVNGDGNYYYSGLMDEVSVYSRSLSSNEIAAIYNAGSVGKCLTAPAPSCVSPPSGLVSWWKGESNTLDQAGGNTGSFVGNASYGGGEVGQSFQFNGSSTYVRVPDSSTLHFTTGMTAEAWVHPSVNGTYAILVKYDAVTGVNQCAFSFFLSSGHAYLSVSTNGAPAGTGFVQSTNSVPASQWTHVAGTYDGSVLKIYLNGALDSSVSLPGTIFPGTDALGIGATIGGVSSGSPSAVFNGLIDEPSLYNRALSANEIAAIYNADSAGKCLTAPAPSCASPPAGLASWWRGENNAIDSVGTNFGTLAGATTYAASEVGQGFIFDGNPGSGVPVGTCSNLHVQDFTVEAWVKRASTNSIGASGGGTLFGYGSGGYGVYFDSTGHPALSHAEVDAVVSTGAALADTNFHHVAVTKSNTTVLFYVDGVAAPALTYNTSFTFTTPAAIGAEGGTLNNSFLGTIDELSVYTRPLNTAEIQSIYNAGSSGKCIGPVAPSIITQPAGQTVNAGFGATFSVLAAGTPPLSYQWKFGNAIMPGATSSTLSLQNVQPTNAGNYSVVISNQTSSITSSNALLTVISQPVCTPPASGLASWWKGESSTFDSIGTNFGILTGGATYGSGEVGSGFVFDGIQGSGVQLGNCPSLQVQNFTVEAWVKRSSLSLLSQTGNGGDIFCFGVGGYAVYLDVTGHPAIGKTAISAVSSSGPAITDLSFHHVAVTKSNNTVMFYLDGVAAPTATYNTTFTFTSLAAIGSQGDNLNNCFLGTIDELSVYTRPLTTAEIQSIYNAGSAGKCANSGPSGCVMPPAGLVSWWTGAGNPLDVAGANHASVSGNITYASGEVGQAFQFDGSSYLTSPASSSLNVGANGFTVECWIQPTSPTNRMPIWEWANNSGSGTHFWVSEGGSPIPGGPGCLYANIVDLNGNWHIFSSALNIVTTNFQHVALTYDHATGIANLYRNGANVASQNLGTFTPQTTLPVYIGRRPCCNPSEIFSGLMDEVTLYSRSLSSNEIAAIYNAGSAGKCTDQLPPVIATQPQSQLLSQGDTLQLTVQATGAGSLGYQWLFNTTNLSGATNSTLVISNVQPANAGAYAVTVSNAFGSVLSSNALITVVSGSAPPLLLDINFGAPQLVKTGPAAIGLSSNDYWNIDDGLSAATFTGLKWSDGSASPAILIQSAGMGSYGFGTGDNMYDTYIYTLGSAVSFTITNLPTGVYNFLVYGHGNADNQNATYQLSSGNTSYGTKSTAVSHLAWTSDVWQENLQYVVFSNVTVASSLPVTLACQPGASGYAMINGMQVAPVSFASLIISQQPQSQTVFAGTNATFTVQASGNAPVTYQWRFNGTNISSATASSLTLTNVQLNQSGPYAVLVSSGSNSILSSNAILTVNPQPVCTAPVSGLVSWWKGESNTLDQVSGNNGSFVGTASYGAGEVGQSFQFDGSSTYVRIPDSPTLHVTTGMTAEAWIHPSLANGTYAILVKYDAVSGINQCAFSFFLSGGHAYLSVSTNGTPAGTGAVQSSNSVPANQWTHVAGTYDGSALKIYLNGTLDASVSLPGTIFPGTDALGIGATIGGLSNGSGSAVFNGLIDEPALYNRALTAQEIAAIYNADAGGKCLAPAPPSITTQPKPQTTTATGNASFSVVAAGNAPLVYQWLKNGQPVSGATNSILALTNVPGSDSGALYLVVITNASGSITSSNAVLTVNPLPSALIVSSVTATSGTIKVPVNLISQGTENTLGFSIHFDNSALNFAGAALNAVTNATLIVNTNQLPAGNVGVAISLPLNLAYAAGTNGVADLSFNIVPATNDTVTALAFADQPIARQVYNPVAVSLPALYTNGVETLPFLGFEGDVFPVTGADRKLLLNDWIQIGRFVAGLDTVPNAAVFQRADCAPRATLGDGYLTVSDWVQAGRYGAALDPVTIVGGPTQDLGGGTTFKLPAPVSPSPMFTSRTLTVIGGAAQAGLPYPASLQLAAQGNENGLEFSVAFIPSSFSFVNATLGSGATNATLMLNTNQLAYGKLGVVLALPTGFTFPAGALEVLKLNLLTVINASGNTSIGFVTGPLPEEVSDASATSVPITYISKTLSVNPRPTLSVAGTGGNLSFSWPASATGFYLESTSTLTPPQWTNAQATLSTNGNTVTATGSPTGSQLFYRLHHP